MKKITLLFIGLSFFSCKKEWLELEQPGNQEKPYFVDAASAYEAMVAAYDVIAWRQNLVALWAVGSVMSDDAIKGGESDGDQQGMYELMTFTATSFTDVPNWIYADMYRLIARANFAIEAIEEIDMDQALKDRYSAECKFLRGYAYLRLAKNFGGMMIYTSGNDISAGKSRATIEETYAQVESDLIAASSVLPSILPLSERGRATKGAADGLLAQAYLFQKKWPEAKTACEEVMNSGLYALVPNYSDVFTSQQQWGSEVVWAINAVEDQNGNWGEHEGSWLSVWFGDRDMGWGYGFNNPTQDFVDAFEVGDQRLDASVVTNGESIPGTFGGAPHVFSGPNSGDWNPATGYTCQKYLIPDAERPVTEDCNGNLDYMYLRYSDVLLMHAEASLESGDQGSAINSLNLVRQRAGLPNYDPTSTVISNYKETSLLGLDPLKASIYHERRVELGLENTRFYDLVRWGVAEAVLHDFNAYGKGNYVEGCSGVLPIPDNDVTVSDGLIEQNNCY